MLLPMAKAYKCPACDNEVERAATVCGNPACRKELAFCSHCHDVSTYVLAEKATGRLTRDRYRCDRCQRLGVRCLTWVAGGYCNGLARTGEVIDKPLCAACNGRASDVGRSMLSYALMGALGVVLRKRR